MPYIFGFLFWFFLIKFSFEKIQKNRKTQFFGLTTLIECLILISIPLTNYFIPIEYPDLIVCLLLFAMGLQNSFVTKISNAIVRTTHLTGLFTDLGIDISQLFFPKSYPNRDLLKATIKLRIYIISFFFAGGIIGGFLYSKVNLKLNTLLFAAFILTMSLFYDDLRYRLLLAKRKHTQRKKRVANRKSL